MAEEEEVEGAGVGGDSGESEEVGFKFRLICIMNIRL